MRRVVLSVGLAALVAVVAAGQPPVPPPADPAPPRLLPPSVPGPVTPAGGAAPRPHPDLRFFSGDVEARALPAGAAETPLAKFEPLAAFPLVTQHAVRAVLLGSAWMTRMNQPQGRFLHGYLPAVRQPMEGDHDLRQAHAALALAQAARFAGDDRQAALAGQAILTLLAATRIDPADPNCRVPVHPPAGCNRVGFAAVLALAAYELPGADEKLLAEAERLCGFLRKQLRADGSVNYADNPADNPLHVDPAGVNEYPGLALHALAVGNRPKPADWKVEAVQKGLDHYRAYFKARPHPTLAATLSPAFAELYLQTKHADALAGVFEMNDWLAGLQYQAADPRHPTWAGGFKGWAGGQPVESAPGVECGPYLQSLACACRLARAAVDVERFGKYRQAAADAAGFLTGLQYIESNTRHFENSFRSHFLIGGFHLSPTDGDLRIDATARGVTGLLAFLGSGAEK